jgi:hypothetical protein
MQSLTPRRGDVGFKLLMSPFKRLNNVKIEVLTNRPFQLDGGMDIRDFAIVNDINDLQRFAKPLRGQQRLSSLWKFDDYTIPKKALLLPSEYQVQVQTNIALSRV